MVKHVLTILWGLIVLLLVVMAMVFAATNWQEVVNLTFGFGLSAQVALVPLLIGCFLAGVLVSALFFLKILRKMNFLRKKEAPSPKCDAQQQNSKAETAKPDQQRQDRPKDKKSLNFGFSKRSRRSNRERKK